MALSVSFSDMQQRFGAPPGMVSMSAYRGRYNTSNVGPVSMSALFQEIGQNANFTSWNGFTAVNSPIVTTTGGVTDGPFVKRSGTQTFFDGTPTTFNIATNGGFTAVCLVRFTGTPRAWERIFEWGNGTGNEISIYRTGLGADLTFRITNPGFQQAKAVSAIVQDQWVVFTAVYTTSTGTMDIYKDNVLVNTQTGVPVMINRTLSNMLIGMSSVPGEQSSDMDIGCILGYDRALTGPELATAYNYVMTDGGTLPAIPVVLLQASQIKPPVASAWATRALSRNYTGPTVQVRRASDGSLANVHSTMGGLVQRVVAPGVPTTISATAVSSSGVVTSNMAAVVFGNAVFREASPFPGYGSLSLPATANTYIQIPSLTGLAWTLQHFTMETWVYRAHTTGGPTFCIGQYSGNVGIHSMSIGILNGGLPFLRYWSAGASADITLTGNTVVTANTWHHLALCSEAVVANTSNAYLYCGGIRQTLTGTGTQGTYAILTTPATFNYPFTLGGHATPSAFDIHGARVLLGNMAYTTSTFTPGLLSNGPATANTALLLNMPSVPAVTTGPTSLVNWLAGNVGFVGTWYDQIGTKHLTETLLVNQPVFDTDTNSVYINNVTGNVFTSNVGLSYGEAFNVTDATFAVNIIPITYVGAQFNSTQWVNQDPIIGGERPNNVNDFALAMQDGTKLGFSGLDTSATVNTGVTNGFNARNVMALTRVSATGTVNTFRDGVFAATGTRLTGNVFGSTPTSIGRCTTGGAVSKLNAKMLALVHSTSALSNASVAFLSYTIGN